MLECSRRYKGRNNEWLVECFTNEWLVRESGSLVII